MVRNPDLPEIAEVTELSVREQKLVNALLAGKSQREAMEEAGYACSTSRRGIARLAAKNQIQSALSAALDRAGVSPDLLATRIREGLDLQDPEQAPVMTARHRYLETALRVGGHEPDKKVEVEESYEERILRIKGELGE